MEAAWQEAGQLWDELGSEVGHEVTAKQILNCASARSRCQAAHRQVDWLLCNLDLDEAMFFFGPDAQSHFGAAPEDAWQIVYLNHEAVTAEGEPHGDTWFGQNNLFKVSPLLKAPFISERFPQGDSEPQLLRPPDGSGDEMLEFWQARNDRLSEQHSFRKRAGGSTSSYFDGYVRGKVAVRLSVFPESRPSIHRWSCPPLGERGSTVCAPGSGGVLHYLNCGGVDWFAAKYGQRLQESQNRLWFHLLAQEKARAGGDALQELYDEVRSVPREALESQLAAGFLVSLSAAEAANPDSESACRSCFSGFWGWALVALDAADVFVHVPLWTEPTLEVPALAAETVELWKLEGADQFQQQKGISLT
ncbi:unnamed protein product [Polarella glacialis]|uniref:Uncharacterized protein n=1 Tax=Polarella glacialis TaxID=89957 RepID=A0A813E7B7_POLGL|nr:unnamed protein product [Polarella glacialis]